MQNLIRHRSMRHLICFPTVCRCPTKRILCSNELIYIVICIPCTRRWSISNFDRKFYDRQETVKRSTYTSNKWTTLYSPQRITVRSLWLGGQLHISKHKLNSLNHFQTLNITQASYGKCSKISNSSWLPKRPGQKQFDLRVFPVCNSDKYFVNFSPENQHFI